MYANLIKFMKITFYKAIECDCFCIFECNLKNKTMVTIVTAHPWHGSFNKSILDTIVGKYEQNNIAYQIIDLNKDGFNPVLTESELALYSKGGHKDPLVGKYQEMLKKTDEIIFIYPMWWMSVPAILKGFFDKVMLYGFSYNYDNGWTGLLTNIKKSTVITTSEQTTANFAGAGDPVNDFIVNSLYSVGIGEATWFNCDNTSHGTDAHRKDFLKKVETHVS